MAKKDRYQLVSSSTASDLSKAVSSKIEQGWELFGSPFAEDGNYCQAVVKTCDDGKRLRKTSGDG